MIDKPERQGPCICERCGIFDEDAFLAGKKSDAINGFIPIVLSRYQPVTHKAFARLGIVNVRDILLTDDKEFLSQPGIAKKRLALIKDWATTEYFWGIDERRNLSLEEENKIISEKIEEWRRDDMVG